MTEVKPGEIVDITIKGVRVTEIHQNPEDLPEITVHLDCEIGGCPIRIPHHWPMVTVQRIAPAEWPPQPGDLWRDGGGDGWFAQRYFADFDDPTDFEGCNRDGWRVVLVPFSGGPYGSSAGRPDEVNQAHGPLSLVHRETTDLRGARFSGYQQMATELERIAEVVEEWHAGELPPHDAMTAIQEQVGDGGERS